MLSIYDESSLEIQLKAQVRDVVEVVENPCLGPPSDDVKIDTEVASRAILLSNSSF